MSNLCLYLTFIVTLTQAPIYLIAQPPATATQQITAENELKFINNELKSLNEQLKNLRKNVLNTEMRAQPYMFDQWDEFAKEISLSEEQEKQVLAIKERIKKLNQRKQILLKSVQNL